MRKLKLNDDSLNIFFSFILAVSFFILANLDMNENFIRIEKVFTLPGSVFTKILYFKEKNDYVLQIKYNARTTDTAAVTLNNYRLEIKSANESPNGIASQYYYIPKDILRKGGNFFKIKFYPSNPPEIDLRIKNYLASAAKDSVILTLKGSMFQSTHIQHRSILAVLFFIAVYAFWKILLRAQVKWLHLTLKQSLFHNIIAYLPGTLLFVVLGGVSLKGPYVLMVHPGYLFVQVFLLIGGLFVFMNFLYVFFIDFIINISGAGEKIVLPFSLREFPGWIVSRTLSDKCILLFLLLFMFSAILYNVGIERFAEQTATVSFAVLAFGLVMKFMAINKDNSVEK